MAKNLDKQDVNKMMHELIDDLDQFEKTHYARSMDLKLDLSLILLEGLRQKGWTQKKLADAVGTKEAYINRVVHASQNCTLDVVGRISHALGVKIRLVKEPRFGIVETTSRFGIVETTSTVSVKTDVSENIYGNKARFQTSVAVEEKNPYTGYRAA